MLVTKKIERFYVVQMTEEQKHHLVAAIKIAQTYGEHELVKYMDEQIEVLDDLRISLLNA